MKRANIFTAILTTLMLFVGISMTTASSAPEKISGESHTILGNYQITETEPEQLGNQTLRKFELTYANVEDPVVIYLNERRRGTEYIVRSKVMEVQYTCNRSGFGAEELNGQFAKYPREINQMFLSTDALGYQTRITSNEVSLETALGLIACYYPELLKNINNLYSAK